MTLAAMAMVAMKFFDFSVEASGNPAPVLEAAEPAFNFAPPAVRWTLMQLLSINSRSGASSAPANALNMSSHIPCSAQHTKRL